MKWFFIVLKKYAVFTGRARRKELWMFTLFCIIFLIPLLVLDKVLGTSFNLDKQDTGNVLFSMFVGYGWFEAIFTLAIFIPTWAVCWRRLHDIGKSGWWNLLFFVPIVGWIILLVWHCTDSQVGENKYGTNPKEVIE